MKPRQCPFYHPPAQQDDNTFAPFWTSYGTQDNTPVLRDPLDQLPAIRAIDPDQA